MNTGEQKTNFNNACRLIVGAQCRYYRTKKAADLLRWEQVFKEVFASLSTREDKRFAMNYAPPARTAAFDFAFQELSAAAA